MPLSSGSADTVVEHSASDMRLLVLEMTIAAVAARLPQRDLEEVVATLVFVSKSSEAAQELEDVPEEAARLIDASHHATAMLDRISKSRRADRAPGRH